MLLTLIGIVLVLVPMLLEIRGSVARCVYAPEIGVSETCED